MQVGTKTNSLIWCGELIPTAIFRVNFLIRLSKCFPKALPPVAAADLFTEAPEGPAAEPTWRSPEQLLLYFFLVRILRQADQTSFAELARMGLRPDGSATESEAHDGA